MDMGKKSKIFKKTSSNYLTFKLDDKLREKKFYNEKLAN